MPGILLRADHPLVRGVVREATGEGAPPVECRSWAAVLEAVRRASPRAVIVAEPFTRGLEGPLHPAVERLRREMPSARVLAVVDSDRVPLEQIVELGEIGVADVLDVRSELTPRALRARLEGIPPDAFRSLLDGSSLQGLPGRARLILERAAEVASEGGYPKDLAQRLRMATKTLRRWSEEAGLPPPRDLFRWLRVLLAASLLDDPGRKVEDVAEVSGYAAGSGLRRAMRAVVDEPPSRLREAGAYREAHRAFLEAIGADSAGSGGAA